MKLYFSPPSPFARKVRLTAIALGIESQLELVSMDVFNPPTNYKDVNPLIKVPALEMNSGEVLVNSPFICQYLAQTTPGGNQVFPHGPELWTALNFQAIADGGAEATMARRWEHHLRAADKFDFKIDLRHKEKMHNAFEFFENRLHLLSKTELTIKEISLISFVDYVTLRFGHEKWDQTFPKTFAWVKGWNENPKIKATYVL